MPARSVCLVTLFLSEAGPGRFGCQRSVTDIYHTIAWVCFSTQPVAPLGSSFIVSSFDVVYTCCVPVVGAAEGWGGWRGHANPCATIPEEGFYN